MAVRQTNLKDMTKHRIMEGADGDSNRFVGGSTGFKCPACHAVFGSCPDFLEHIANHLELAKPSEFFYFSDGQILLLDELDSVAASQIFIPRVRLTPYEQMCKKAKIIYSNPGSNLPTITESGGGLSRVTLCQTSTTNFNADKSFVADSSAKLGRTNSTSNQSKTKPLVSTYNPVVKHGPNEEKNNEETDVDLSDEVVEIYALNEDKPKRPESKLRIPCAECGKVMHPYTLKAHLALHEILKRGGQSQSVRKAHNCHICNKKFKTKHGLHFHIQNHETIEARNTHKWFQRKLSQEKSAFQNNSTKHLVKHDSKNPPRCQDSGRNSVVRSQLKRPLVSHFDNLKFSCDICAVKIATLGTLKRHMEKMHNSTGPLRSSFSSSKNCSRFQNDLFQSVNLTKLCHPSHLLNEALPEDTSHIQIEEASEATTQTSMAGNDTTPETREAGNKPVAEIFEAGHEVTAETSEAVNAPAVETSKATNKPTVESSEVTKEAAVDASEAGNEASVETFKAGNEASVENSEAGYDPTVETSEARNEPTVETSEPGNEPPIQTFEAVNEASVETSEAVNQPTVESSKAGHELNAEKSKAGSELNTEKSEAGNELNAETYAPGNEPFSCKNNKSSTNEVKDQPISMTFVEENKPTSKQSSRVEVKGKAKKKNPETIKIEKSSASGVPGAFVCKYCPKRKFTRCYVLKKHIRTCHPSEHAQELKAKKLLCKICGHPCKSPQHRYVHMQHAHPTNSPKQKQWYTCEKCPSRYRKEANLEYHVKLMHSSTMPETQCSRCQKRYRPDMLRAHEKRGSCLRPGEKLPCQQCGEQFSTKNALTRHARLHATSSVP